MVLELGIGVVSFAFVGMLLFILWKEFVKDKEDIICVFFFVHNVQEYFEGLIWDLRRISNWYGKDIRIFVTDLGSSDDTVSILERLCTQNFIKVLSPKQAAKYLRTHSGDSNWIFNLKTETDVKEIRKCFVKIFNESKTMEQVQKETL